MQKIELIFDNDCPNVEGTKTNLEKACAKAHVNLEWQEWERSSSDSPSYARHYGSPTVLIDGKDIAGIHPHPDVNCCRIYEGPNGKTHGIPSVDLIVHSLLNEREKGIRKWLSQIAVIPGIGFSLLPNLTCPACWPAYAGLLGVLGLGFLLNEKYLFSFISVFLVLALGGLLFQARKRRGLGPFFIGLIATSMIIVGKFFFNIDSIFYLGLTAFMGASIWNIWPPKISKYCPCPSTKNH